MPSSRAKSWPEGDTCSASRAWWNCERRAITVVTKAMPMSPPMFRKRLTIPETWLFFEGGTRLYISVLIGTNRNASPDAW